MLLRQSDLKLWARCPLAWKYKHIDHAFEEQSASSLFGSVLHDCVMHLETNHDLPAAILRFKEFWLDPSKLDPSYEVHYYVKGTNWRKFADEGPTVLTNWWNIIQWDADLTLAREYTFDVPIGSRGNRLSGTVDKLNVRYNAALGGPILLVTDYKTNNKVPTYGYLEEDLQFSAYCYATTQPEFWANLPPDYFAKFGHLSRRGEWVQLRTPRRMDAGERTQRHYNRLEMAVDAMADSVAMRIFVPNISGETCRYCDFRKLCGLPEIEETN